jgi:hypothetical protein
LRIHAEQFRDGLVEALAETWNFPLRLEEKTTDWPSGVQNAG